MRLCFYNPHLIDILGTSLFSSIFVRGKARERNQRLNFLLELLHNKKYNTAIVVDGTVSSLPFRRLGVIFNNRYFVRLFSFIEIYLWCLINHVNPFRVKIIFSFKKLDSGKDVLFGFAFLGKIFFDSDLTEKSFFSKFAGKKMLHATHFYEKTELVADNVKKTNTRLMVSEVNLKNSPYFSLHFSFIDLIEILPFWLRDRYTKQTKFSLRKNKCVALGTLAFFPEGHEPTKEHFAFFGVSTLHPMRKTIYDSQKEMAEFLDCFIVTHRKKPKNRKRGVIELLISNLNPATEEYHSFDIVKVFNDYKMFVAPEETIGPPSINVIEGMACGAAYIGLDSPLYADMGLEPGVHYIGYNGTLDDLKQKIAYFQAHPVELEEIARVGHAYVVENFKPERVVDSFAEMLGIL